MSRSAEIQRQLSEHAITVELSLIGTILAYPSEWQVAAHLAADLFIHAGHAAIWTVMLELAKANRSVNETSVRDALLLNGDAKKLPGGAMYLLTAINGTGPAWSVADKAKSLEDLASRLQISRRLADAVERIADLEQDADVTAVELSRDVTAALAGSGELTQFSDIDGPVLERIEARVDRYRQGGAVQITGARTGIRDLDEKTAGLQPGWAVVIAAETGGGKTALAVQTAINTALDGGTALVCNLEMPVDELAERAIIHLGRVNSQLVRVGQLGMSEWKALDGAARKLREGRLFLEDGATTLPRIVATARRWRNRFPAVPGLLVVDFLQLIRSERARGVTRAQEVGAFAYELKSLAKELRVPVIVVSQLNRVGVKADRPSKSDLRDSGDIENAADLILLPWISEPEKASSEPIAQIIVDKFRGGQSGISVPARWVGRHFRFEGVER